MAGINETTGAVIPSPKSTGAGIPNTPKDTNVTKPTINEVSAQGNKDVEGRVNEYIEGVVQVVPNCDYKCKKIYGISGVGSIFSGNYYVQKVTHTISDSYTVNMEVTQVEQLAVNTSVTKTRTEPVRQDPPKAPEAPKYQVITIKWGDTLWALSRKYGTTVQELAKINNIKNPDLIYAGAPLKVPAK